MHNEREGMPITALREIKVLKALQHPNIVELIEIAFQKGDRKERKRGTIFMVFPYLDHDLSGLILLHVTNTRPAREPARQTRIKSD
jgi:serine/threonine-protein kinase BUR1